MNQLKLLDPDYPSAIEAAHEAQGPSSFCTIHYLGSKLWLLDFIEGVIDSTDSSYCGVCDLFSSYFKFLEPSDCDAWQRPN